MTVQMQPYYTAGKKTDLAGLEVEEFQGRSIHVEQRRLKARETLHASRGLPKARVGRHVAVAFLYHRQKAQRGAEHYHW